MAAALIDYLPDDRAEAGPGRQEAVAPSISNVRTWPAVGRSDFTGTIVLAREIFNAPTSNPSLVLKAKIVEFVKKRTEIDTDITYGIWASNFQAKRVVAFKSDPEICRWLNHVYGFRDTITGLKFLNDPQSLSGSKTFDAIQALYLSNNRPRDKTLADRITELHRDALAEDEDILPEALIQFTEFFLAHPRLAVPKITLTPDRTLRTRWIHGPGNFAAIEFTGEPNAKLVAEIPRDQELTATHFASEPLANIIQVAEALGASFQTHG
jgi:hypothetical protein